MGYLLDIINKYLANDIQNIINKDESEDNHIIKILKGE